MCRHLGPTLEAGHPNPLGAQPPRRHSGVDGDVAAAQDEHPFATHKLTWFAGVLARPKANRSQEVRRHDHAW